MKPRSPLLCALLLATACGSAEVTETPDATVPVRVGTVERRSLARTVQVSGRLAAHEEVQIVPRASGQIVRLHRDEGDYVKAGELLIELDKREPELELARARAHEHQAAARLEDAERVLERKSELFERNIAARADLDSARVQARIAAADLENAIAGRKLAAQRLDETEIRAPIDGILQDRTASVGDFVGSRGPGGLPGRNGGSGGGGSGSFGSFGDPIFTLIQIDPLKLEINVAEQDVPYIEATDARIRVAVDVYPEREFFGRITYIAPSLHPLAHTQLIRLIVPNPDHTLKPGMFTRIRTTRERAEATLVIPAAALMNLGGVSGVYVVNGTGEAHLRTIETAFSTEQAAAIRSGLREGEQVVIEGQSNLRDGSRIRVVPGPEAAGGS
ncbi:MAG: efflux RND transporter periplasmic adaptor subunit [Myxococcales bacterium]|nr:efflux RND transporter periplasmic adaptor subunit [Myxococcales bacterium]